MSNKSKVAGIGPVLITGGAGFLGRHLAARLDRAGHRVTVLDDLSCANSTFDCAALAGERIAKVEGSVFDHVLVDKLVRDHAAVVHFASVVGVEDTVSHTIPTIENLNGTINVVRALTPDHVAVFGSSADVYGAHSHVYDRAMREDDLFVYENGRVNRWVYPHVKSLEENLFANSAARAVVVRIFNTYGPEMDFPAPKRVIPHFIDCILDGRPLLLSGDGAQVRSFCFVDDMIDGFLRVLGYAADWANPRNECFNLGHPEPISIRELAGVMLDCARGMGMLGEPLPVIPDRFTYSQSFDDRWHRTPDIRHAKEVLGFAPGMALRDGLTRTLAFYRDLKRAGRPTLKSLTAHPHNATLPGPLPMQVAR
jgi:nucleoside-diphosphate-sugar epimerase